MYMVMFMVIVGEDCAGNCETYSNIEQQLKRFHGSP